MITVLNDALFIEKIFNYKLETNWNYKGELPCMIDFYADWCKPCKAIKNDLEALSEQYKDLINVFKINVDEYPQIAQMFGIKSIPSLLLCKKNENPQIIVGAYPKEAYESSIKEFLLKKSNVIIS